MFQAIEAHLWYNRCKKNRGNQVKTLHLEDSYGDYRVFTKVFKKSEGITPSQHRRDFLEEVGKSRPWDQR